MTTTQQTGQEGGLMSSAIPAIPDDGTSQGRRRTQPTLSLLPFEKQLVKLT